MVNYFEIGKCLMKNIPLAEGCASSFRLNQKGIQNITEKNPELGKALSELTEGIDNPSIELAQKAQGNYGVAGFKIKSGGNTVVKGAYSTAEGTLGTCEKVHIEENGIITNITKEGGSTSKTVREISTIKDVKKTDNIIPQIVKPHNEIVDDFITEYANTIKGMDTRNFWVREDLLKLTKEEMAELKKLADIARQKGIKIPYDKDKEFIEIPLAMPDGRLHKCKIFARYYDHKIGMRMFLDNDIPSDKFNTTQDIAVTGNGKIFGGTSFQIEHPTFDAKTLAFNYNKQRESKNIIERLKAELNMAEAIQKCWTKETAERFTYEYSIDCEHFLRRHGKVHSVLEPNFTEETWHKYRRF